MHSSCEREAHLTPGRRGRRVGRFRPWLSTCKKVGASQSASRSPSRKQIAQHCASPSPPDWSLTFAPLQLANVPASHHAPGPTAHLGCRRRGLPSLLQHCAAAAGRLQPAVCVPQRRVGGVQLRIQRGGAALQLFALALLVQKLRARGGSEWVGVGCGGGEEADDVQREARCVGSGPAASFRFSGSYKQAPGC